MIRLSTETRQTNSKTKLYCVSGVRSLALKPRDRVRVLALNTFRIAILQPERVVRTHTRTHAPRAHACTSARRLNINHKNACLTSRQ